MILVAVARKRMKMVKMNELVRKRKVRIKMRL